MVVRVKRVLPAARGRRLAYSLSPLKCDCRALRRTVAVVSVLVSGSSSPRRLPLAPISILGREREGGYGRGLLVYASCTDTAVQGFALVLGCSLSVLPDRVVASLACRFLSVCCHAPSAAFRREWLIRGHRGARLEICRVRSKSKLENQQKQHFSEKQGRQQRQVANHLLTLGCSCSFKQKPTLPDPNQLNDSVMADPFNMDHMKVSCLLTILIRCDLLEELFTRLSLTLPVLMTL